MQKKILFIFGTRPDAIKCAPLIHCLKEETSFFEVKTCVTGQHKEMLSGVMNFFAIQADFNLEVMQKDQTLISTVAKTMKGLEKLFKSYQPDLIIVQGDANPALAGALAGFYKQIPIAHLEAGLRSGNKKAPFPEEGNRILVSQLTSIHFAPTKLAAQNLRKEGIYQQVYVTGNTVIDALFYALKKIKNTDVVKQSLFASINFSKKIILITGHRRESFGQGFANICKAILELAKQHPELEFVYPVHLNPNVQEVAQTTLAKKSNIHLLPPLDYPDLLYLMDRAYLLLTDSGGIQEEAPSLGKPVLVMREVTERVEGIKAGTSLLVGTDVKKITKTVNLLLEKQKTYQKMAKAQNPYGDGQASQRIAKILLKFLS